MEPEDAVPGTRVYSAQSLGVSLGGSGGAPTALTGDTDMNGDMEGDYNSSSGEPDEDVDGEEGMSSGEESDEDSKSAVVLSSFSADFMQGALTASHTCDRIEDDATKVLLALQVRLYKWCMGICPVSREVYPAFLALPASLALTQRA